MIMAAAEKTICKMCRYYKRVSLGYGFQDMACHVARCTNALNTYFGPNDDKDMLKDEHGNMIGCLRFEADFEGAVKAIIEK